MFRSRSPKRSELHAAAINRTGEFAPVEQPTTTAMARHLHDIAGQCLDAANRYLVAAADEQMSAAALKRAHMVRSLMQRTSETLALPHAKWVDLGYICQALSELDTDPAELTENQLDLVRGWIGQARAIGTWREIEEETT